jgi:hypothetical protein
VIFRVKKLIYQRVSNIQWDIKEVDNGITTSMMGITRK